MKDFKVLSDRAILETLGNRLKQERLNQNVTQAHLADLAGVSVTVVKRAEAGKGCTLNNFVRLLRSLDKLDHLDVFLPEPGVSPMALAQLSGKKRREATGGRGRPPKGRA
jgi:putative transcriptional regulator